MLELIGVDRLTQWDVGRQINVDKDVDMVHFSNRTYGYSKNVKVTDGVADVPDMFLTSCAPLRVWAYVGDFEKGYTKIEKIYEVKPKNRPENYIYTPEEVKTWEKLQSEIGDIANLETEAKENLVVAINELAADMSEGIALDTTLTQIGKAADAKAVGDALAEKADISDIPAALPNPNALTFTGAVNATYDGSSAVSVEIPSGGSGGTDISLGLTSAAVGQIIKVKAIDESGKPTAWEAADMPSGGGGGTSEEFILLAEVTLEEDVKRVTLPLSSPTKHFITRMWCPKTSATSDPTYLSIGINGNNDNLLYYLSGGHCPSKDHKSQCTIEAHGLNDGNWAISAYTNLGDAEGAVSNYNQFAMIPIGVKNNGIMQAESVVFDVVTNDATQYFPVGSILRVWGV